jgi:hypothetical protein
MYGSSSLSEEANSIVQTDNGDYIICGVVYQSAADIDIWIIRTDSGGNLIWNKTYGGNWYDTGSNIQKTNNGHYVIVGSTMNTQSDQNVWVLKIDDNGDTLWTRSYGGQDWDAGSHISETDDEGYIITGYTCSYGPGNYNLWLIRTNSVGDTNWTRVYGDGSESGHAVHETRDYGYIVIGSTWNFGAGNMDMWLVRTNSYGDTIWTKTYGGSQDDGGEYIDKTSNGGYILTGSTSSYGAGSADGYIIKLKQDTLKINEKEMDEAILNIPYSTFFNLSLSILNGKNITVFDVTGRQIHTLDPAPGIYFIEVDGEIRQKVIKIR